MIKSTAEKKENPWFIQAMKKKFYQMAVQFRKENDLTQRQMCEILETGGLGYATTAYLLAEFENVIDAGVKDE